MLKQKILWVWVLLIGVLPISAQVQKENSTVNDTPVTITWYVGLGGGRSQEKLEVERQIVEAFNNSQDDIILELECVCGGIVASEVLDTMIANGIPLDIIGPVPFISANRFTQTDWLDLQPLVDSHSYNLSQFPSPIIDAYRTPEGGLSALPFATYPSVLYYNLALFDLAGLRYPPTEVGEFYVMPDGSQVPWDYETVAEIGQLLTVDSSGRNAVHPDFDPNNVVSYGFNPQWDTSLRSDFHAFGDASLLDENGQVIIHDNWREQVRWIWDGVWKTHFIPPRSYLLREEMGNQNAFGNGYVAMARSKAWYTCCLDELEARWDIALPPAYNGTIYAPVDLDGFYIHKTTRYPEESFIVLQYLLEEAAPQLVDVYQVFPARPDLYTTALDRYREHYPKVQNWEVFITAMQFIPAIYHESVYPNYGAGQDRLYEFAQLIRGENGATIDLDAELDRLQANLQTIVNAEE